MRSPARTFEDLVVWQKAHALALSVYRLTRSFPREERFGLTSQLRRAAVSVPGNIAEGFKRRGRTDKARLMNVAEGSLEEARYYLKPTPGACVFLFLLLLLPPNSFLLTPSS